MQERKIVIETATILKIIGIFLILGFLYLIRDILALLFAALFLAALMHPAVIALSKRKVPKGVTVIFFYLIMFGVAALTIGLLLPPIIVQTTSLIRSLGKSWQALAGAVTTLRDLSTTYGLSDNLRAGVQSIEAQVSHAAVGIFSSLTSFFGGLIGLIVVLVMAYYMVVQDRDAHNAFQSLVPEKYKDLISSVLKRVEEKIGKWLIGQLSLCLIIGVFYYIGLSVIGVNAALVLAIFGGFTEFIPYLGPILGAIPVLIIAFSQSSFLALLALLVVFIIQELEGHIIVPKVMQKAVGLNPLVSIVALLVGAKLFGIVGALLAIPVATAISAALTEFYRYRSVVKKRPI